MTSSVRPCLALLGFFLLCSCSGDDEAASVVIHRCGSLNLDSLSGTYGRLDGGQSINSKFRIRFSRESDSTTARFVAGGHERFLMAGRRTGNETMDFVEQGSDKVRKRRLKVSLNAECRLQVEDGWISGAGESLREQDHPAEPYTFVPFDLSRLDFEPCTEGLAIGKAARSRNPGTLVASGEVPVVTSDTLPIAQWSAGEEVPQGCSALLDLWVNGEAEALDVPIEGKATGIHWSFDYETRFLGKKGLALHRHAKCAGEKRLLGVACAEIEVR